MNQEPRDKIDTFHAKIAELQSPSVDDRAAAYVMSLLDRRLGNWDDVHIKIVTGHDWKHWRAVFELTKNDFESVFRAITTKQYLTESFRYFTVKEAAERWNHSKTSGGHR